MFFCCLLACGPEQAVEHGQALASNVRFSPTPSNLFACTTCHSVAQPPEQEGRRLSGHPLVGAASRPTFWGGGVNYLLDAVNQCYVEFMRGDKLAAEDPQGLSLLAYLRNIDTPPDAARPCTVVPNIDASYLAGLPQGDAKRGSAAYTAACGSCHGQAHTGEGRIGPRVSTIPEDTLATFGPQARAVIVEKVRHGKFFAVAGIMPFFCKEILSDADLSDILAYLFN